LEEEILEEIVGNYEPQEAEIRKEEIWKK